MTTRFFVLTLVLAAGLLRVAQRNETPSHMEFSLVRGSAALASAEPHGMMADAAYTVLVFTTADGHRALLMTEKNGDYTAVLQPGRYCLSAYQVKTGELIPLDPRQLKCINVVAGKDLRLDVMLHGVNDRNAPVRK